MKLWFVTRVLTCSLAAAVCGAAERPDVVVIVADDLGWRDLGVTGSDFYQTPRIDGLFRSGVTFARAYASCQVCSPTRASLLTGKAPVRHGITDYVGAAAGADWKRNTPALPAEYRRDLPPDDVTLAEALRDAGYATHYAGKWHLGGVGSLPTDHGFDTNIGGHENGSPPGGYFSPYNNPYMTDGPAGEHLPLRLARETAAFLREKDSAPKFAVLAFHSVHGPLETTRARFQANRLEALARPAPAQRFAFDRTMPVRVVQDHPIYAGMVEAMDDAVGVVLDAIASSGKSERTVVVFTSDNGGVSSGDGRATSCLPLRGGKGKQWEGGLRVPLAIALPGTLAAGTAVDGPAITTDLYPTLLDLAGLPARPEQHLDGVSLAGALRGGEAPDRALFWHYPHYGNQGGEPSSVASRGGWKLIRYHEDGREELYNLAKHPGERRDLIDSEPARAAKLSRELDAWLAETGAKLPTPNPAFDAAARAAELRSARTQGVAAEERGAAAMLEAGWSPGPDWWGSEATRTVPNSGG